MHLNEEEDWLSLNQRPAAAYIQLEALKNFPFWDLSFFRGAGHSTLFSERELCRGSDLKRLVQLSKLIVFSNPLLFDLSDCQVTHIKGIIEGVMCGFRKCCADA